MPTKPAPSKPAKRRRSDKQRRLDEALADYIRRKTAEPPAPADSSAINDEIPLTTPTWSVKAAFRLLRPKRSRRLRSKRYHMTYEEALLLIRKGK